MKYKRERCEGNRKRKRKREKKRKRGKRQKGGSSFFRGTSVLYIWRLVQAITIDNRPIGTTTPYGSSILLPSSVDLEVAWQITLTMVHRPPPPPPATLLAARQLVPFQPPRVIHDQIGSGNFTFMSQPRWFIIMFAALVPPLVSSLTFPSSVAMLTTQCSVGELGKYSPGDELSIKRWLLRIYWSRDRDRNRNWTRS